MIKDLAPKPIPSAKNMAHNILKQAMENPEEKSILAFVESGQMMTVTDELVKFINNPEKLYDYKRPDQTIKVTAEKKKDFVFKHALGSLVFQNDSNLTFEHTEND